MEHIAFKLYNWYIPTDSCIRFDFYCLGNGRVRFSLVAAFQESSAMTRSGYSRLVLLAGLVRSSEGWATNEGDDRVFSTSQKVQYTGMKKYLKCSYKSFPTTGAFRRLLTFKYIEKHITSESTRPVGMSIGIYQTRRRDDGPWSPKVSCLAQDETCDAKTGQCTSAPGQPHGGSLVDARRGEEVSTKTCRIDIYGIGNNGSIDDFRVLGRFERREHHDRLVSYIIGEKLQQSLLRPWPQGFGLARGCSQVHSY